MQVYKAEIQSSCPCLSHSHALEVTTSNSSLSKYLLDEWICPSQTCSCNYKIHMCFFKALTMCQALFSLFTHIKSFNLPNNPVS